MMQRKTTADFSLDLDNKWSYLKTHGDESWVTLPSYLDKTVPHVLSILREHDIKITVFVVGQDAEVESNQPVLRSIVAAGHEIGNHSFQHEPWMQRYDALQLKEEFDRAEQSLAKITDQPLRGFRGPGYSLSNGILELLCERGYLYDASTLPSVLGPAARAYYFLKSNFTREQAEDREQLFGRFSDGFRPLKPYRWQTRRGTILEMPVTTMPLLRLPFHFSYLLYLLQYSELIAMAYFRTAMYLCRGSGVGPSLLLHPTDVLGSDDVDGLEFFPAMNLPGEKKRAFVRRAVRLYTKCFDVVPMAERASRLLAESNRPLVTRPTPQLA